ncbi:hypothetical protein E2C01_023804 [Portunus trituberculatus]|uniref:Uncharacterized protein n=1 Tax=Portunus trituberculatus TaxID=210409 RepID=A0A5B7EAY9_PORTR|nr:hypothetical protein [Portunus trituberculatus]
MCSLLNVPHLLLPGLALFQVICQSEEQPFVNFRRPEILNTSQSNYITRPSMPPQLVSGRTLVVM